MIVTVCVVTVTDVVVDVPVREDDVSLSVLTSEVTVAKAVVVVVVSVVVVEVTSVVEGTRIGTVKFTIDITLDTD